jgi:hypothetical protein
MQKMKNYSRICTCTCTPVAAAIHKTFFVRLPFLNRENDITAIQKVRNLPYLASLMDNLPVIRLPAFREGRLPSKYSPIHASYHSTCIFFHTESIVKAIPLPQKNKAFRIGINLS